MKTEDANIQTPFAEDDLHAALTTLWQGGVILYPTDTIWGLGCDALCEDAVRRIYRIKQRNDSKALILLSDSLYSLQQYVFVPEHLSLCTDRPTTIIYPHARNLPSSLTAADGSIAFRLTAEPFSQTLCAALGHPLVSTSANRSGQPSPACFQDIDENLLREVDYVCRYRQNDTAKAAPSRIIRLLDDGTTAIIRP